MTNKCTRRPRLVAFSILILASMSDHDLNAKETTKNKATQAMPTIQTR